MNTVVDNGAVKQNETNKAERLYSSKIKVLSRLNPIMPAYVVKPIIVE
ncbi:hypothetical protein FACS189460_5130 [Deltaproteobacteria bacterium]|nr:hypothetical protein FACS189460_5130 [Deltaproteobacteria bacterium]